MEPKKFLFVSLEGLIGDIAWRIAQEGHEVKYVIKNPEEKELANGFVQKAVSREHRTFCGRNGNKYVLVRT
jgi:hypothetical protein